MDSPHKHLVMLKAFSSNKVVMWLWGRMLTARIIQYIPRNMHTIFALLCFVMVIHWLIFPYPSSLLHWHCGNRTIAPVPAKQPWWIWINTSCKFIMNDCITTKKQSTTKPCAYYLEYTVRLSVSGSTCQTLWIQCHANQYVPIKYLTNKWRWVPKRWYITRQFYNRPTN